MICLNIGVDSDLLLSVTAQAYIDQRLLDFEKNTPVVRKGPVVRNVQL